VYELPSLDISFASFSLYQDKENEGLLIIPFVFLYVLCLDTKNQKSRLNKNILKIKYFS